MARGLRVKTKKPLLDARFALYSQALHRVITAGRGLGQPRTEAQRRELRGVLLVCADALLCQAMGLCGKARLAAEDIKDAQFHIDDALTHSEKNQ